MNAQDEQKILFFDGVCGLCNSFVDFVMTADTNGRIRFSPLQGKTAARLLPASDIESLNSVVYFENGEAYRHSTAALKTITAIGGIFKVFGILFLVPAIFRDPVYNFVARNRYKWFGKKETCRIPTPEERARFLD